MSNKNLILTLAKVIIAAAWADGEMTLDEINHLKELLFRLPHDEFTELDWARLDMYIETPVDAEERSQLMEELRTSLQTPEDKTLALSALDHLIQAEGTTTDEERIVVQEIRAAIESAGVGVIKRLGRLAQSTIQRRSQAESSAAGREEHFEDFVRNRIYYALRQRLDAEGIDLGISETALRRLSLISGLMVRVAYVDQDISDGEFDLMVATLQRDWGAAPEAAVVIVDAAVSQVSIDLDYFRLTRQFFSRTTRDERIRFLDNLFAIASADGDVTHEEVEEIRSISQSLSVGRRQFIDAKRKVVREQEPSPPPIVLETKDQAQDPEIRPVSGPGLAVVILGSPSDREFGQQITTALRKFGIPCEVRIASAHKTPEYLLDLLEEHEAADQPRVYVTVAGRSNALSGMVDAAVSAPVIACPPHSEKFGGADIFSSLRTPSGVAPAVVLEPSNAALLAAKILGLTDPDLRQKIADAQAQQRQRLIRADKEQA